MARTPADEGRVLVGMFAVTLAGTLAWWVAMFLTRRPALDALCVLAATPLVLLSFWVTVGCQLVGLMRRDRSSRRPRLVWMAVVSFLLGPYSFVRAGHDAFTLSLRYHVWRAGGPERVRAAFDKWVAERPPFDATGRKWLFSQKTAGGSIDPLPLEQFPPEVRYIHEQFPNRFGITWEDVARIDNVSVLTTSDILIGPPGWEPEGGVSVWQWVTGTRRKVGDGIWVEFGVYNK